MTKSPDALTPTILIVGAVAADPDVLALERQGLRVRLAANADAALAALADGGVSLVLADIALPDYSGIDLCALIKAGAATRHLPVLLTTAAPDPAEGARSRAAGACDYLPRPIDGTALTSKILAELAPHALEVNYHAMLAHSSDAVVLIDIDGARLIDANLNAQLLYGLDEAALLGRTLAELCPPLQPGGQSSATALDVCIAEVLDGRMRVFDMTFQHAGGRLLACEMRLILLPIPDRTLMHVRIVDISKRKLADRLCSGQGELLEMVARGAALADTLDRLMLLIESQSEGAYCSVLLLDEDGTTIHPASAPSLPPAYMAALEGLQVGPSAGSCGAAIYRKETVIVSDIYTDPLWAPYTALAAPYGLRTCWSTPIYLDKNHMLGAFAMYYREVRRPDEHELHLIAVAGHLAGIAIERTRRERELARYRENLEQMVAARTAELTLAKEHADRVNEELAATLQNLSLAHEALVRRDKLAALGTLVAGVAHELNTPIGNSLMAATTIAEHTRALVAQMDGGLRRSELDAYLRQAGQASDLLVRNLTRAAGLVASFKQIAVDQASAQRRHFKLGRLLAELMPSLRVAARGRAIAVVLEADPALFMDSYPGPLLQVLTNLFDNCLVHAFADGAGGTVRIGASAREPGLIALSVRDDGAGIAAPLIARVYDPFFTTRLGSGGSGLGLHVAHNIVSGILGGRIELRSAPGAGSSFTLLLPAHAPAGADAG